MDPDFGERLKTGLKWSVIPAWIVDEFPDLPNILQQSLNAGSQTGKHEGEMQILLRIHREWASAAAAAASASAASSTAGVKFADIKAKILKSNPPCKESIPSMYKFVLKCSGGHDPVFLREDEAYVNSQASSDRKLAPDFYDVLADDLKTGSDQCQRFKHALFRLGLTCKLNVVNGDSKFITASDAK